MIRAIHPVLAGDMFISPSMAKQLLQSGNASAATSGPDDLLTSRELEIFRLIGDGLSISQIAKRLHRGVNTMQSPRENIKRKLAAQHVSELVGRATWTLNLP